MHSTIRQRRHLEYNSLRHAEQMKADERVGDVTNCTIKVCCENINSTHVCPQCSLTSAQHSEQ